MLKNLKFLFFEFSKILKCVTKWEFVTSRVRKDARGYCTQVNDENKVDSCGDVLKTRDVIKDVLDDIVESVVKESKISLNNQLSAGVGINENDFSKLVLKILLQVVWKKF